MNYGNATVGNEIATNWSAMGNAFQHGKLLKYAKGGIVNSPTIFPMANGAGVMGESGPEAIMPLKRGANGKLGVEGSGDRPIQNTVILSFEGAPLIPGQLELVSAR